MFRWIANHRTYTLIVIASIVAFVWVGYTNVWEPVAMMEDAKVAAGESVDLVKDLIEFMAQKDILDLLKVILPVLAPILLYKRKASMDKNVKRKTNYVVREKMGIADRRKNETPAERRYKEVKYQRRTDPKKNPPQKKSTTTKTRAVKKK